MRMIKTIGAIISALLIIFALSGCAGKTVGEEMLLEDLNVYRVDLAARKDVVFTELEIEKRRTDDQAGTDDVYVRVFGESEELSCEVAYRLMYVMYNDGWSLEEVQMHDYESWKVVPKKGVDPKMLEQIMTENYEFSEMEPSVTNEELDEGQASYSYIITRNYNYSTQYDTVRIDCRMNPYTYEWDLEHSVIAQREDWDISGTWYFEGNSMISGMEATVEVDSLNSLEFVGSYHMEKENFLTDEIEDIWSASDMTRQLEVDKLDNSPVLKIGQAGYDPGYEIGVVFDHDEGLLFTYFGDVFLAYMEPMTRIA